MQQSIKPVFEFEALPPVYGPEWGLGHLRMARVSRETARVLCGEKHPPSLGISLELAGVTIPPPRGTIQITGGLSNVATLLLINSGEFYVASTSVYRAQWPAMFGFCAVDSLAHQGLVL